MSTNAEVDDICASCGITRGDIIPLKTGVKLKRCNACKLVQYCSVACQKEHRLQHKRACRKRASELREELLFKQPEISHLGECPICCLPLPLDLDYATLQTCCSKIVCDGCSYACQLQEEEGLLESKCPFCRMPTPEEGAESYQYKMKRIAVNDPVAIRLDGVDRYIERNYRGAFEQWTKAAELGDIEAHYQLAILYMDGQGVERDRKKEWHHWEEAAIGGHPGARYNLGVQEARMGRTERAMKHYIIAAKLGHNGSMERVEHGYVRGVVEREDRFATLRAHDAAVDATKSSQREAAEQEQGS